MTHDDMLQRRYADLLASSADADLRGIISTLDAAAAPARALHPPAALEAAITRHAGTDARRASTTPTTAPTFTPLQPNTSARSARRADTSRAPVRSPAERNWRWKWGEMAVAGIALLIVAAVIVAISQDRAPGRSGQIVVPAAPTARALITAVAPPSPTGLPLVVATESLDPAPTPTDSIQPPPTTNSADSGSTAADETVTPSGAEAILTPTTETLSTTSADASDATPNVVVGKWSIAPGADGGVTLYGELLNHDSVDTAPAEVSITIRSATGNILARQTAYSMDIVRAGGKGAWSHTFTDIDPAQVASADFTVLAQPLAESGYAGYTDTLTVTNIMWHSDRVTGEVTNQADVSVEPIHITLIGYDSVGNVVGVTSIYADNPVLEPGETTSFTAPVPIPALNAVDTTPATIEAFVHASRISD